MPRNAAVIPGTRGASKNCMFRAFIPIIPLCATLGACGPPAPVPSFRGERAPDTAHSTASLDGVVLGVDEVPPGDRLASGLRVRLQPRRGREVVVDLAPGWYLDRHGVRLAPSDRIRVEGSYTAGGDLILFARSVETRGNVIHLRSAEGRPLWR